MGDVLHALPAVAALRRTWPDAVIDWAIHPKWRDLLDGSRLAVSPILIDRHDRSSLRHAWRALRAERYTFALDLQGLVQSALAASVARSERVYGFDRSQAREPLAAWFYTHRIRAAAAHVVERGIDLAEAAGAHPGPVEFPLPPGRPEGDLPARFVLASPLAGWTSKQWPLEYYAALAKLLDAEFGLPLVLNAAPSADATQRAVPGVLVHLSGISGLIDATRRATAVVGLDSGPMHLAAALAKPGVALFGPTDPERNGPYGGSLTVLRAPGATTSYRRGSTIGAAMRALTPGLVFDTMSAILRRVDSARA